MSLTVGLVTLFGYDWLALPFGAAVLLSAENGICMPRIMEPQRRIGERIAGHDSRRQAPVSPFRGATVQFEQPVSVYACMCRPRERL